MQRVIAEIEDRENDTWGFDCPSCGAYLTEDHPQKSWVDARCGECDTRIRVTFFVDEPAPFQR